MVDVRTRRAHEKIEYTNTHKSKRSRVEYEQDLQQNLAGDEYTYSTLFSQPPSEITNMVNLEESYEEYHLPHGDDSEGGYYTDGEKGTCTNV
jgi:hypothetical protein